MSDRMEINRAVLPLCKLGVIADVQYGDIDDVYSETKTRYYRKSLNLLRHAIDNWQQEKVDGILQLGDIIEGFRTTPHGARKALATVLEAINQGNRPVYHTLGNHELYHFTKLQLLNTDLYCRKLTRCIGPKDKFYYSVNLHKKLRVIVLDCYDYSLLGLTKTCHRYNDVKQFLKSKNPNEDLDTHDGMTGIKKRFVRTNGAIGTEQMKWLNATLEDALRSQENVVIIGHVPAFVFPGYEDSCLWDINELQETLSNFHACVLCYLSGHLHAGGSGLDNSGIHHIVIPAVLECEGTDAHGTLHLYSDRLVLNGKGSVRSQEIKLKFPIK